MSGPWSSDISSSSAYMHLSAHRLGLRFDGLDCPDDEGAALGLRLFFPRFFPDVDISAV